MTEKDIENKSKFALKQAGCYYIKNHGSQYAAPGIPDIIFNLDGWFIALEVKRHPNKPTMIQQFHLKEIRKNKGIALIVNELNLEKFCEILKRRKYEDFVCFSKECFELFKIKE